MIPEAEFQAVVKVVRYLSAEQAAEILLLCKDNLDKHAALHPEIRASIPSEKPV